MLYLYFTALALDKIMRSLLSTCIHRNLLPASLEKPIYRQGEAWRSLEKSGETPNGKQPEQLLGQLLG